MKKSHLVDVVGAVVGTTLAVSVIAVPGVNGYMALYAGLGLLLAYAYVSFDVIPKAEARRAEAEQIAADYRKVLVLPLPSEMENRRGIYPTDQRARPTFARAADL